MVKAAVIEETATELVEQIVLKFDPEAEVFVETKKGDLEIKRKYADMQERIIAILNNNINGGK